MNPILGKRQYLIAALLLPPPQPASHRGVLAEWNLAATPLSSAVVPSTVNVTSATSITFADMPDSGPNLLRASFGKVRAPPLPPPWRLQAAIMPRFTLTDTTPMDLTSLTFAELTPSFPTRPAMPWNRAWMDLRHM